MGVLQQPKCASVCQCLPPRVWRGGKEASHASSVVWEKSLFLLSALLTRVSSDLQPGVLQWKTTYQKEESSTSSIQGELGKPHMRDKAMGGGQREINRRLELFPLLPSSFTRWNSSVSLKEGRKKELLGLNQTRKWLRQNHPEQNFVAQAVPHRLTWKAEEDSSLISPSQPEILHPEAC